MLEGEISVTNVKENKKFKLRIWCTADGQPILPRVGDTIRHGGITYKVKEVMWFYKEDDEHHPGVLVFASNGP